jgi:hypothetical protein
MGYAKGIECFDGIGERRNYLISSLTDALMAMSHPHHFISGSDPAKPPLALLHGLVAMSTNSCRLPRASRLDHQSSRFLGAFHSMGVRVFPPLSESVDRLDRQRLRPSLLLESIEATSTQLSAIRLIVTLQPPRIVADNGISSRIIIQAVAVHGQFSPVTKSGIRPSEGRGTSPDVASQQGRF